MVLITSGTQADAGTGFDFVDGGGGNDQIVRNDGGSWLTEGYGTAVNVVVHNATTPANDGTFAILAVTASTIDVATATLTADTGDNTAIFTTADSVAGAAVTACFGDGPSGDFRIGRGEIPGNELLSAGTFLEWYFEVPGGGGDFGSSPPANPRAGGHAVLTGNVILAANAATDPLIPATANVTGGFLVAAVVQGTVIGTASLSGGSQIAVTVTGQASPDVTAAAFLFGGLVEQLFPELSPNARAEANQGIKPCLPLLIRLDDVSHIGNLHQPDGVTPKLQLTQAFRMSPTYSAPPGDRLAVFGATPNAIGMRVLTDLQGDGVEEEATLFRRPLENEVVVLLDGSVEKFNSALEVWESFTTLPQRALLGMRVFEILDPDKIWDYYASLVSLKYAQLSRDTRDILDFIDPDLCPFDQLPLLAENFGVDVLADSTERTQRETLRQWVPLMQIKGLANSIVIALRTLGFSGFATQIWTKPNALATEFIERPFNYSNELPAASDPTAFFPSASVAIHLNNLDGTPLVVIDDLTKQLVATFLKRNILPAHVQIRTFVTDIVVGSDAVETTDAVTVIDDAHIALLAVQAGPATTVFVVSILPIRVTVDASASLATTAISGDVTPP